jgi:hypothetical protein
MRDLSRARQAVKKDLQGKRQRISSLMLRLGRIYPGETTRGPAHMKWLMAQKIERVEQRIAFEHGARITLDGTPSHWSYRTRRRAPLVENRPRDASECEELNVRISSRLPPLSGTSRRRAGTSHLGHVQTSVWA